MYRELERLSFWKYQGKMHTGCSFIQIETWGEKESESSVREWMIVLMNGLLSKHTRLFSVETVES